MLPGLSLFDNMAIYELKIVLYHQKYDQIGLSMVISKVLYLQN